jgi:hypothetical protein
MPTRKDDQRKPGSTNADVENDSGRGAQVPRLVLGGPALTLWIDEKKKRKSRTSTRRSSRTRR